MSAGLLDQGFPVVDSLVRRHAEDAGFYWSQHDGSAASPRLTLGGLDRFERLLSAHLDGLEVAGLAGIKPLLEALERWKKPGEVFACTWALVQAAGDGTPSGVSPAERRLWSIVNAAPDALLRGLISAIAWSSPDVARTSIARVSTGAVDGEADSAVAIRQTAALRASALVGADAVRALALPLSSYSQSPSPHVRAATCRASIALDARDVSARLRAALLDPELQVRAEAAIALTRHGEALVGPTLPVDVLWHAVLEQAGIAEVATGWYRKQTLRRLDRWVRHLAWAAPLGRMKVDALFGHAPPAVCLGFIAHHGDPAHLPWVVERMAEPDHARRAGWVWHAITGVDLVRSGLTLPVPPLTEAELARPVTTARMDADLGLPLPNVDAVRAFPAPQLPTAERHLLGRPLTASHALDVLEDAPQALRSIAAQALAYGVGGPEVHVRGPVAEQRARMAALRQRLAV